MGFLNRFGSGIADYFAPRSEEEPTFRSAKDEIGVSGVTAVGGFLTSNESSSALAGIQKYTTFSNTLLNTSIVAAGVRHFLNLIGGVRWKLQAADESKRAQTLAENMENILHGMDVPFFSVVKHGALSRFMGFSISEKVAKKCDEGYIGLETVAPRPQRTIEQWDLDPHGNLRGVVQVDPNSGTGIYIPRHRMFYVCDNSITTSPDGVGLLRHVVELARRLERYQILEGYGFETDLRGVPIGRAPVALLQRMVKNKDISPEDARAQLQGMINFMNGHIKSPTLSLLMDSTPWTDSGENGTPINMRQWDLELLKTDSGAQEPVHTTIERINREIARVLGVEHLLLGGGERGSQALAGNKTQSFAALIQATVDEVAWQVDRDIIKWIWELNGWPEKLMPKSVPDSVSLRSIEEVVDSLVKLAQAGAPLRPNDPAVNEVRTKIGLTDAPEIPEEVAHAMDMAAAGVKAEGDESTSGAKPKGGGAGAPPGGGSGTKPGGVSRAPEEPKTPGKA